MIEDARVLQPEFIPQEIKHRDAKTDHLSTALSRIADGRSGNTAILCGPSGAGKTCVAKFTVNQLHEHTFDVTSQYVNCWQNYRTFNVLYRLLEGIDRAAAIHRQSTPTDVLLDRLEEYDRTQLIAILDEVDQLEDMGLLYDLYRIPNLTMVLIANQEQALFSSMDERLYSRLATATRISFDPYSLDELVAILRDRVRWGLTHDPLDEAGLEAIADAAAGDARTAIGILRIAAQRAQKQGRDDIPVAVIEDAVPEAKAAIRQKSLDTLTAHQRTLYDLIADAGEIEPGTLHERYRDEVDNPKTERTVRNYLQKLEHYNLIASEGATKGRSYRLVEG